LNAALSSLLAGDALMYCQAKQHWQESTREGLLEEMEKLKMEAKEANDHEEALPMDAPLELRTLSVKHNDLYSKTVRLMQENQQMHEQLGGTITQWRRAEQQLNEQKRMAASSGEQLAHMNAITVQVCYHIMNANKPLEREKERENEMAIGEGGGFLTAAFRV
jgi:hypothetical protein